MELGRNSASKHHIQPEYGDEQADAGTGLPNPSRETKSSGANADKGKNIFPVQLTTNKIGNLTRLIHTLAICVTIPYMIPPKSFDIFPPLTSVCSEGLNMCVLCVCFLPIHSGHQWTYQPGSHRREVTQDFSSTFFLRCVPLFFSREGFSHSFPSSIVKSNFVY